MSLVIRSETGTEIGIVTMNRAEKRNALSLQLMRELREAIEAEAKVAGRRVILLMGNGPAFCAGLDLVEARDSGMTVASAEALAELYETICELPLVTIACVQGAAIGGGAGLAAACDLVVGEAGMKMGFPEVRLGLVAALVTCLIRRQVGDRTARELILLGETIGAERAIALGLINRVAEEGRLMECAMELAGMVCKGRPGAIARSKGLLESLGTRTIGEEIQRALRVHLEARGDAEGREGVAGFGGGARGSKVE